MNKCTEWKLQDNVCSSSSKCTKLTADCNRFWDVTAARFSLSPSFNRCNIISFVMLISLFKVETTGLRNSECKDLPSHSVNSTTVDED